MYSKKSVYNKFNIKVYIILFVFFDIMTTQYNIVITINNIQDFVGTMNVTNGIITSLIDSTTQLNAITPVGSSIQGVVATNTYSATATPSFGYFILQGDQYTSVLGDNSDYIAIRQSLQNTITNWGTVYPLTSITVTPLNTNVYETQEPTNALPVNADNNPLYTQVQTALYFLKNSRYVLTY